MNNGKNYTTITRPGTPYRVTKQSVNVKHPDLTFRYMRYIISGYLY
jgi:hypothetical protein